MKYKVVIEWNRYTRKYTWQVTVPGSALSEEGIADAYGSERRISKARARVAVALQQLKAEHEEDLRNAGKRIEFEGEL